MSVLRRHSFFPSPPQRSMTSDFEGFSIPDFIHYIYFPILILWYDAVLDLGLNSGPPALETSTLPLGYRRGGKNRCEIVELFLNTKHAPKRFTIKRGFVWRCHRAPIKGTCLACRGPPKYRN